MTLDTPDPEQLTTADNALIIAALLSFPVCLGLVLVLPEPSTQMLVVLVSAGLNSAALVRLQMIPTDAAADGHDGVEL